MNELLTAPSPQLHPPQQSSAARPVRRVGLLDRLALRVGLALIVWARHHERRQRPIRVTRYPTANQIAEAHLPRDCGYQMMSRLR